MKTKLTELEANYNPKIAEQNIKDLWSKSQYSKPEYWENLAHKDTSFTMIVPPPNLTGNLHAGHAFEHFFMDTLARLARQRKFKTLYFPGVDHAGIQLEGVIDKFIINGEFDNILHESFPSIFNQEKSDRAIYLKKTNLDLYLDLAWSKVNMYRANQLSLADEIGDSPDFDKLLFTLDDKSRKMVTYAFERYWKDDLIYKDSYLINWSVALQTALSDVPEDISRAEVNDPFITYRYDLENIIIKNDSNEIYDLKKYLYDALGHLMIGTVRIETAMASKQLMAHPESIKRLLQNVQELSKHQIDFILEKIQTREIIIQYQIPPIGLYQVELYLEDSLDPNFGTGIMKFTPAHDPNDYELSIKHQIYNFPSVINKQGKLTEVNGEYSGMNVYLARIKLIYTLLTTGFVKKTNTDLHEDLSDFNAEYLFSLVYRDAIAYLKQYFLNYEINWDYTHNVVICERSKSIVEPLISQEWFIDYKKEFVHNPNLLWKFNKLKFNNLSIIKDGLELNSIKIDFANFLYQNITDEDINLLLADKVDTLIEAQTWIYEQIKHNEEKSRITLSIKNNNNEYIGYCCLRNENDEYKLTIWISSKHRKMGYGKIACEEFINWIFNNLDCDHLVWEVKSHNYKSIMLAEKLNFKLIASPTYDSVSKITSRITQEFFHVYHLKRETTSLQKLALKGIDQTAFFPSEYKQRGAEYYQNIKNWCISRDLVWGIKIPVWYNIELNPEKKFFKYSQISTPIKIENKVYQIKDLFRISDTKPTDNGNWVQETKILDTWFSSTLWPLSTLDFVGFQNRHLDENKNSPALFDQYYPSQLMTTAWEIFYAWIVRMIMSGMYFTNNIPFENYYCHAWILDEKGRKMSKSLGNVFDPRDQVAKYSIDAVRLGMLSGSMPGKNMRFEGKIADLLSEKYRNLGNKIHNIARFFEYQFNQEDDNLTRHYCYSLIKNPSKIYNLEINAASIWILEKFVELKNTIDENTTNFDVGASIENIYKFIWDDFASSYLEYLKSDNSQIAFGFVIYHGFIQLLYPFSPFQAEFINQSFFKSDMLLAESLINLDYFDNFNSLPKSNITEFDNILQIIEKIRSTKALFGIDPVKTIQFKTNDNFIAGYSKFIFLSCKAEINNELNTNLFVINGNNWSISLDLKIENISNEYNRSVEKKSAIEKQITVLKEIFENQKFISNATAEIIEQKKLDLMNRNIDLLNIEEKIEYLKRNNN